MKKGLLYIICTAALGLTIFESCKPDPDFNAIRGEEFGFHIPEGWPQPFYNFENNALTKEGFELGKKLFFDGRLSRTNNVSCETCHQPTAAFAQFDHPVSHGVDDLLGTRNSPALFNLNWHTSFFWDGGVNHIESQPINPIKNPVEMDETLENVIAKLNADATYRSMFKAAFGDETINTQRISKALAQYMGMLVSDNAKYDKHMRGEAGGTFTDAEERGYTLFKAKCATCHTEPLFTDFSFRNNGLFPTINDSGRAHITIAAEDMYKFKVPSLRNLKYTYPYMHDGRIGTVEEVLDYYASGKMHQSQTLDPVLKNGGIPLTTQEKQDLLSFLETLNDEKFVADLRFRNQN